jgi:signal peptidase I
VRRSTAVILAVAAACGRDAKVYNVPSCSMAPTLQAGGRVAVTSGTPRRGDIVVYRVGQGERISRVVGVAGDHLETRDDRLFVNGAQADEPYVAAGAATVMQRPVDVPAASYFLMGDNRINSQDSRYFGPVKAADIVGRARRVSQGDGC